MIGRIIEECGRELKPEKEARRQHNVEYKEL
jgi:hypothetical protein